MSAPLRIIDKIQQQSIKIAPFKKQIRKTQPHKHNSYFEIIYLTAGSGFHAIDLVKYPVRPPVVFTVRKEQVHHWELETEPEGFVLILKKEFVDQSLDGQLKMLLAEISASPCIQLPENMAIPQLFQVLTDEYQPTRNNNTPIVEGILKALLGKILHIALPIPPAPGKKESLFLALQHLLSQGKQPRNSVSHYASALHTSPQNLNTACRKAGGQSAAQVLAGFIISEAKRLLIYTEMTVSEIAILLDFKDNSHFVKFFKRYSGQTPNAFRQSI